MQGSGKNHGKIKSDSKRENFSSKYFSDVSSLHTVNIYQYTEWQEWEGEGEGGRMKIIWNFS